ncbi:hypothetical protein Hte_008921 [Hypoxylon texense]
MSAAQAVLITPVSPVAFTYRRCRRLHQKFRQEILDYRAAPRNSLPPPKPKLIAVEPAPTFLLGASAAKYAPSEARWSASLAEHFWTRFRVWTGDFYDRKNPYRLSYTQSAILAYPLYIYSQRAREHAEAAKKQAPKPHARRFICRAPEVAKRLDRDLSTYVGPGQILAWLILDLRLISMVGCTEDHVERAIGSAIVELLGKISYIQDATYRLGSGVWVTSRHFKGRRQIADVHVSVEDDILSSSVILNVENPIDGDIRFNPWTRLEAADIAFNPVTSTAVEAGWTGHELGRGPGAAGFIKGYRNLLSLSLLKVFGLLPADILDHKIALGDIWNSIADGKAPGALLRVLSLLPLRRAMKAVGPLGNRKKE